MLDASGLALLVTALLAAVVVLALVGLVVGSHLWVRRADSRARASQASVLLTEAAAGVSPRPRAALLHVGAEDGRALRDALDRSVRTGAGTSLLVSRYDDVLPSSAQLDGAAVALEDPDTAFVTFADDDTAAARVRADRGLVLAAPGPIAVRAEAVLEAGGWPEGEPLPETDLGARMLGLGWRGAALGVAPGAVCDPRARERQVAWHLVRRHRGLLVARHRRAGADLGAAERSALLAATVVALTSVPSAAELSRARAWLAHPRLGALRPEGPSARQAALGAAGLLVVAGAAAAFVALPGSTAGAGDTPVTGRSALPTGGSHPGDDLAARAASEVVSAGQTPSASLTSAGLGAAPSDRARPSSGLTSGAAPGRPGGLPTAADAQRLADLRPARPSAARPRPAGPARTTGPARPAGSTGHARPPRSSRSPRPTVSTRPTSAVAPKPSPKPSPTRRPSPTPTASPRPPEVRPGHEHSAGHGAGHGDAKGHGHGDGSGHGDVRPGKGR